MSQKSASEISVSIIVLGLFMSHMDEKDIRPNTGTRIGYVRVSTVTQTLNQQQDALGLAGVSKTFSDTMSGARDDRPGLADFC
jgi:hypothetical protein